MHLRRFSCSRYVALRSIALIALLASCFVSLGRPVVCRAQSLPGQMSLHLDRSVTNRLNYWFETPTQRLTEPKELRRSPGDGSVLLDASVALNKPSAYLVLLDTQTKKIAHLPVPAAGATAAQTYDQIVRASVQNDPNLAASEKAGLLRQWEGWRRKRARDGYLRSQPNLLRSPDLLIPPTSAPDRPGWFLEQQLGAQGTALPADDANLPDEVPGKAIRVQMLTLSPEATRQDWHAQLRWQHVDLKPGQPYTFSFWVRAHGYRPLTVYTSVDGVDETARDFRRFGMTYRLNLTPKWQKFMLPFLASKPVKNHSRLVFAVAEDQTAVELAGISLRPGTEKTLLDMPLASTTVLQAEDFSRALRLQIPVLYQGKPVRESVTATLMHGHEEIGVARLEADDNGLASFVNVPLDKDLTLALTDGANRTEQTRRFTAEDVAANRPVAAVSLPNEWTGVRTLSGGAGSGALPLAGETSSGASNRLLYVLSGFLIAMMMVLGGLLWRVESKRRQQVAALSQAQTFPALESGTGDPIRAVVTQRTVPAAIPAGSGTTVPVVPPPSVSGRSPVPVATKETRLIGVHGEYTGYTFTLSDPTVRVGRDLMCGLPLPQDQNVSRRHAVIQRVHDECLVTDEGSSNGTFVNGIRIPANAPHPLQSGDEVQFGASRFRFEV